MKERPILFSAPMVRAILAGTKTETRRPVTWHFDEITDDGDPHGPYVDGWPWREGPDGEDVWAPPRFGVPGDRLWVRETWCTEPHFDLVPPRALLGMGMWENGRKVPPRIIYAATEDTSGLRKRSSIHMPRWASRIDLEIECVHVERLHAIRCWGIRREGIDCPEHDFPGGMCTSECTYLRYAFASGWNNIYGRGSWDSNPAVWVVTFRRMRGIVSETGEGP